MKYLGTLQRKKAFNLSYVAALTENTHTAKSLLQSYKRANLIKTIRRNLYTSLDLATRTTLANRFEIACSINDEAYVSYHSALEYHGIANQVFNTVNVATQSRFTEFSFEGITYQPCHLAIHCGIVSPPQNPLVRVTDLERTIVDCLDDINRAGGLEELLQALKLVSHLDEDKLVSYLEAYDRIFLWQKTGFVLEQFKPIIHSSQSFLSLCQKNIRDCKHYLTDESGQAYFPAWKLYAPKNLLNLFDEQ